MNKIALGLASAGAFIAITVGMASPAYAAPDRGTGGHDAAHAAPQHPASTQAVDYHGAVNAVTR